MSFKHLFAILSLGLLVHSADAVVAPPPLPAGMVGSFEGLLRVDGDAGGEAPSGKVEFITTATGKFTGKLTLTDDAKVYALTGSLIISGDSTYAAVTNGLTLSRGTTNPPMNLAIKVLSTSAFESTLTVPNGSFQPRLTTAGIRVKAYGVKDPVCEWMGTYTLALAHDVTPAAGVPNGEGYAAVVIDKKGVLKYTGKLADGSKLTGSLNPSADRSYRWFVKPYTTVGSFFAGRMVLEARTDNKYHVAGIRGTTVADLFWRKVINIKDKVYPAGFGPVSLLPLMEPYTPPAKNAVINGPVDAPVSVTQKFSVSFSGAGLPDAAYKVTVPTQLRLNTTQALIVAGADVAAPSPLQQSTWTKVWTGKVAPTTGVFTGTFTLNHVDTKGKTVSRKVPYEGVILQFQNSNGWALGQGFYLVPPKVGDTVVTTTLSGRITFSNPVTDPIAKLAGTYSITLTKGDTDYPTEIKTGVPSFTKPAVLIIASDLSSATFNGKKVPMMTNLFPTAVIFSNFTSSPFNFLTLTITLDEGQPDDFSADYAKPSLSGNGSGASFYAHQAQIVKNP